MTCRTTQIPGGFIITCSREKPRPCKFCGARVEKLCDFPLAGEKKGATCSAQMCKACSTPWLSIGDLCPPHSRFAAARFEQKKAARAWLEDQKASDGFTEAVEEADVPVAQLEVELARSMGYERDGDRWMRAAPVKTYGTKPLERETPVQGGAFEAATRRARDADERRARTSIAEKVAYVKAQPQTREHHCHWPGCEQQVPPAKWGCGRHWKMLPFDLRTAIWNAYDPGQERSMTPSRSYVEVAREVQDWITKHYPPKKEDLDEVDRRAVRDLFPDWEVVPKRDEPPPTDGEIG